MWAQPSRPLPRARQPLIMTHTPNSHRIPYPIPHSLDPHGTHPTHILNSHGLPSGTSLTPKYLLSPHSELPWDLLRPGMIPPQPTQWPPTPLSPHKIHSRMHPQGSPQPHSGFLSFPWSSSLTLMRWALSLSNHLCRAPCFKGI